VAGIFLERIEAPVQLGDLLRGESERGFFNGNGIPKVLDELDSFGNGELFQLFERRSHRSIGRLDVCRNQTF